MNDINKTGTPSSELVTNLSNDVSFQMKMTSLEEKIKRKTSRTNSKLKRRHQEPTQSY